MKDLYRMAHRRKSDGQIVRIPEYFDLATVQKRLKTLNEWYKPDYEYFLEKVDLRSLPEDMLLELVYPEKLALNDVSSLLPTPIRSSESYQMSATYSNPK
jgi:hypothetical protein